MCWRGVRSQKGGSLLAFGNRYDLPENALIAVVIRGNQPIIPRGANDLLAGDRVVLISLPKKHGPVIKAITGERKQRAGPCGKRNTSDNAMPLFRLALWAKILAMFLGRLKFIVVIISLLKLGRDTRLMIARSMKGNGYDQR